MHHVFKLKNNRDCDFNIEQNNHDYDFFLYWAALHCHIDSPVKTQWPNMNTYMHLTPLGVTVNMADTSLCSVWPWHCSFSQRSAMSPYCLCLPHVLQVAWIRLFRPPRLPLFCRWLKKCCGANSVISRHRLCRQRISTWCSTCARP